MNIYRQITANNIELTDYSFLKELAMEAYLMENEDILRLDENDFSEVTVLDAEIALKAGRKTSKRDGRIDILAAYGADYLSIVELKVGEINGDTLSQLEDYLTEKEQIIERYPEFWSDKDDAPKWVGVVVGSSISPELQRKLYDGYITNDGIPIAGMVIKRYRSNQGEIFVTTDTYFKYNYTNRDYSKFIFNGEEFGKGRLVNKVLKTFVEQNPKVTFAELEAKFPKHLQGSYGVFDTIEKAQEIAAKRKRHYIKAEELIRLSDSTISSCTQWGVGNIMKFVNHINENIDDFHIESPL